MNTRKIEWGVVQELAVEADTDDSLVAAITIAMSYNSTVSHFRVESKDGSPILRLLWSHDSKGGTQAFLTPLTTPEHVVPVVRQWLNTTLYPTDRYNGDGSTKKGFRVELDDSGWSYTTVIVKPAWIIYGK